MSIKRLSFMLLLTVLATSVKAETINCTPITSVPATITAQGIYCLTGNLATSQTSGNAITINAPNVTIDLNGWKLGGQGAGLGTAASGIYSSAANVTIKNGIVRGFFYGINLTGSGAVVQDMLVDSNTYVGIVAEGQGALVEHNQVVNTGGTTLDANVFGIAAQGTDGTVSDNEVSGLTANGGDIEAIETLGGSNTTVRNNVISNTAIPSSGTSYGIINNGGIALNNAVSNFSYCVYSEGASIYAYNTANSCTTSYSGGTAGAGNSP